MTLELHLHGSAWGWNVPGGLVVLLFEYSHERAEYVADDGTVLAKYWSGAVHKSQEIALKRVSSEKLKEHAC